jgi:hypothetical protein
LPTPAPKPTSFVPSSPSASSATQPGQRQPIPTPGKLSTFAGGSSTRSFGQEDAQSGSSFSQEYSQQWDTGPVRNEQVIETTGPDGSISLKRIFQEQQSSSTSKVTSTRKIFQQKQENTSQESSSKYS